MRVKIYIWLSFLSGSKKIIVSWNLSITCVGSQVLILETWRIIVSINWIITKLKNGLKTDQFKLHQVIRKI